MTDPVAQWFIDLCRELFQLEEKYGYTVTKLSCQHVEIVWRLKKGDHEIVVMEECVETFGVPTIQFCPPNRKEIFGLHEALPALDPKHDAKRPKDVSYSMTKEQLRALLEHWAEFFHAHAEALFDQSGKTFAAVKHFRKTKPDPYP
jgi:hypothetical protein